MITGESFVSYAQNREDVVLSRLLRFVTNGRFIDIGAGHPQIENVTYALYLAGWRGINVEPMAREAEMLRTMRPDDETVQAAVGEAAGTVTLYEAPLDNRGATTAAEDEVQRYAEAGVVFTPFDSPMVTLSSLLGQFEPGSVHVVKIDVEGMEEAVLAGADLSTHRPWVLVIEATEPNTTTPTHERWEHLVLDAGYVCVLFDGLNRFYVRDDLTELRSVLGVPANVLDHWEPAEELTAKAAVLEQRSYIQSLKSELALKTAALDDAEKYVSTLTDEIAISTTYAESLRADLDVANEYTTSLLEELEKVREWATSAETYALSLQEMMRSSGVEN